MDLQTSSRPRRPRPKVVTLTDAAADRVRDILARAEQPYAGLRVGVKNGGCAGQEYVMEYAEAAGPLDEVVEDRGVRILVEPKAVLFLIGMLGQGLVISVLACNQMIATQAGVLSSMLPSMLLSGFLFPVENLPTPLRIFSNLVPARHFIAALRGVLLRGNGFAELSGELLALAAFAATMLLIAALRFRRRLD